MSIEEKLERLATAVEKNNALLEQNIKDRQAHVDSLATGGSTGTKKAAAEKAPAEKPEGKKPAAKKSSEMTEDAFVAHCTKFLGDKESEGYSERKDLFVKIIDGEAEKVDGKKNAKTVPAGKRAQVVEWFDKFAKGEETPYSEAEEEEDDDLLGD